MAAKEIAEDYACSYCSSKINLMRDPRELPCKHVFCITCLQEDYEKNGSVTCPVCHEMCVTRNVEELPKVLVDDQETTIPTTTITCDGHGCEGLLAVIHCVECGDNYCATHQQTHKGLFGEGHKEVPIHVYDQSPEIFGKPICEQHWEDLVRACQRCDKLVCVECDIDGEDCTGGTQHDFRAIKSLTEETDLYLDTRQTSAVRKLKEMVKLDKDVLKSLDVEEVECEKRVRKIIRVRDEQIKEIQDESEKLIKRVCDHQEKTIKKVESFCTDLMAKKEQLEDLKLAIRRLLRDGHITEKIRQKQRITKELSKYVEEELDSCHVAGIPALISTSDDVQSKLSLKFVDIPSSLEYISQRYTNSACYSANHRQDGDILIGTADGVHLLSRDGKRRTKYNTSDKNVTSVIEYHKNIYILHRVGSTRKVEMCLPDDITKRQELFHFKRAGDTAAVMAVSDRFFVADNSDTGQLIIYDFITKQTNTTLTAVYPYDLYFLPDGHLLGVGDRELTKYRIENGLSTVWICKGLVDGNSVCADSDGLIYVCTLTKQTVYIISADGVKLQELTHTKLPATAGCISVKYGVLAVPGWEDKKLHLFKINRGVNTAEQ